MRKQLCWLHISDIHFRTKAKLDQADAFTRMRSDLRRKKAEGFGPDFIFVTGDMAHGGQPDEFGEVAHRLIQLCDDSGLSRDRVFFCPGNHDSDRTVAPLLLQGCWSAWHGVADFHAFLGTSEYVALSKRQAAYRAFVRDFRGDDAGFDSYDLHAFADIILGDLRVRITSLNSALLAAGGPEDKGHLQLCVRVLDADRGESRTHQVAFTLVHHPFDWLAPFEADRAEALVLESADVVLRGHLHQPRLVGSLRGGVVSAAGAVWETSAGDYEYSLGSLTFETLGCEIETVRFIQHNGTWMSSHARTSLSRSLDEGCTPGAIRAELEGKVKFPSQIAAVLSGYGSELIVTDSGRTSYFSSERILAESLRPGARDLPALGVMHVGNLLAVYGSQHLRAVLRSEAPSLVAYDAALQLAATADADFAALVSARELDAERLTLTVAHDPRPWTVAFLARLVALGDATRLAATPQHDDSPLVARLKKALAEGARDPFEAWLAIGGPEFSYAELATLATRLAVKDTVDLAKVALFEAAQRFPQQARELDAVARIVASELSASDVYADFQRAVSKQ